MTSPSNSNAPARGHTASATTPAHRCGAGRLTRRTAAPPRSSPPPTSNAMRRRAPGSTAPSTARSWCWVSAPSWAGSPAGPSAAEQRACEPADLTTRQIRFILFAMADLPKIISVDDHVVEPPTCGRTGSRRSTTTSARASCAQQLGGDDLRRREVLATSRARTATGSSATGGSTRTSSYPLTRLVAAVGLRPRRGEGHGRSPTTRCGRAAATRRPASRTWTPTGPRRRCASRRSRASAARRSSRRNDKELALTSA